MTFLPINLKIDYDKCHILHHIWSIVLCHYPAWPPHKYMYKTVHMKRPKIEGMSTICHSLEYIKLGQNDIYNNSVDK